MQWGAVQLFCEGGSTLTVRGSTASTVYPVTGEPPLEAGGENVVTPEGLAATFRGTVGRVCRGMKEHSRGQWVGQRVSSCHGGRHATQRSPAGKAQAMCRSQVHWAGPWATPAMHFDRTGAVAVMETGPAGGDSPPALVAVA